MPGEVALRLLLKGQREMAAGLAQVTKETGDLGKTAAVAGKQTKALSGGLDSVQKMGVGATASTRALVKATQQSADAQQAAAAAAKQAADVRLKAAAALADATAKQAAGDLDGAKAAKVHADALQRQATAANRSAIAMRASAGAAREQVSAIRASQAAMAAGGGGGMSRTAGLAKVGGVLTKTGLAVGAYGTYEGVKRVGSFQDQMARLHTLANVPASQIGPLSSWAMANSVRLREPIGDISQQLYRIASSSPGKPYSVKQIESLTRGAANLALLGGPGTDPTAAAQVIGMIRANGGLGTKNTRQIVGIARSTVGAGDMTVQDYIDALGSGLGVNAARHKINLTQLGGVLAEEGDLGVRGSKAGIGISHAISLLASPSPQAQKLYGALGLDPTTIDQIIRTRGLTAGVGTLKKYIDAHIPAGASASKGQFTALGYSRKQATQMAKQGPASLEDLYLTRMFGGAKQSIPIVALYNALSRTGGKTAEVRGGVGGLGAALATARNTPTSQWKAFDLEIQHVENDLGKLAIPKLISLGHWLEQNKTAVKDVATALGVLAVPAIAAYAGTLVDKGVTSTMRFTGVLRGANSGVGTLGQTAEGQAGGLGRLGNAVMGVTAAIGVWELGKATRGHGTGGAVTAGLGGAVTGMIVGLSMSGGDPLGGAIGGAIGGLEGLASHFHNVQTGVDGVTSSLSAMDSQLRQSLRLDRGVPGKNTMATVQQWLLQKQNAPLALALQKAGVTSDDIRWMLRQGPNFSWGYAGSGAATLKHPAIQRLVNSPNLIGGKTAFQDLLALLAQVGGDNPQAKAITSIFGHHHHKTKHRAGGGPLDAGDWSWVGETGPELIRVGKRSEVMSHQAATNLAPVIHIHVEGCNDRSHHRELAETVKAALRHELARQH